ncbi:hypothetical protein LPJ66_011574, partial [Kickxella alabastrina]
EWKVMMYNEILDFLNVSEGPTSIPHITAAPPGMPPTIAPGANFSSAGDMSLTSEYIL